MQNRKIVLLQRPEKEVSSELWQLKKEPVPDLVAGQVLIKVEFISMDPTMRAWMNEGFYDGCIELDRDAMWAFGVGTVLDSQHPDFIEGDAVHGMLKAQDYAISAGEELDKLTVGDEPLSYHAGIFGMTGMTSYFGITAAVHCGGRGWLTGSTDCQTQGRTGYRYCGWPGKMQIRPGRTGM